MPTWHEVGGVIGIENQEDIVVFFLSEVRAASGNDFEISYITFKELEHTSVTSISKYVNETKAAPGDLLTYTIIFKNTSLVDLSNLILTDPSLNNTILNDNSLKINNKSPIVILLI